MSLVFFLSILGGLFFCSFSSFIMCVMLMVITLFMLMMMYWNLMSVIPLYLFSLFTMGGLYVLVGFVIMADINDLDMMFLSSTKVGDFFFFFFFFFFKL